MQKASKRVKFIRDIVREVAGLAPYERRCQELLKVGKDKRALKLCKRKVGLFVPVYSHAQSRPSASACDLSSASVRLEVKGSWTGSVATAKFALLCSLLICAGADSRCCDSSEHICERRRSVRRWQLSFVQQGNEVLQLMQAALLQQSFTCAFSQAAAVGRQVYPVPVSTGLCNELNEDRFKPSPVVGSHLL